METGMAAEPPLTGVRFANDISGHYQQRESTPANASSGFTHGRRPSINQRANSQELSHALDLADPANRQAPSPDVAALLDRKRQEHERARKMQQETFQAQMRELEAQQAAEEARLLGATSQSSHSASSRSNSDMSGHHQQQQQQRPPSGSSVLHSRLMPSFNMPPSASAPTTPPPRSPAHSNSPNGSSGPDNERSRQAYERMSRSDVLAGPGAPPSDGMPPSSADWMPNYNATAPTSPVAQFGPPGAGAQRSRMNKAKSQPVSRRHSGDDLQADGASGDGAALADGFDKMHINGNVNSHRSASSSNLRDAKTSGPPGSEAPLLTSFLFDDELDAELNNPTFDGKYLAMTDEDKFPILVRRDSHPGVTHLSAASAALDLAPLSQTPPRSSGFMMHANSRTSEWPQQNRQQDAAQRQHQQPFRTRGFDAQQIQTQPQRMASLQHPGMQHATAGPMSSHASLSPVHSRVSSPVAEVSPRKGMNMPHAATAPGSPVEYATNKRSSTGLQSAHANGSGFAADYPNQSRFLPYSSSANTPKDPYAYGELNRSIPSPQQQVSSSRGDNGFGYGSRMSSRGSAIQHLQQPQAQQPKRLDDVNRFAGLRLEDLQGDMASLCKDQHGCRFLQRKLEEGNPQHRDMIFAEVYPHFADLMVDSFGNYLAQRLLEFSSDEQKDILITSVHDDLVSISLNIHGTRAIQRLIDHLTTPRQVSALVSALNGHVVTLIKDLNGNHVIQKCLNSLKPEDNQFIYNAVTANCIEVATHRHGCCVLQRCIDHASESQRLQLVTEITYQCLTLVQDPFSNYVVQYCLEFDRRFVEAIIRQFQGNVCALSCHKFSSNVIEKCIRVADNEGRRIIVGEMLERGRLERLVKDNFANYVVQTACDFADPVQRDQLVQQIRPLLPQIRNTPYGKRIAARIQRMPQPTNRFMGYPMSGGFAYGPPQLGYPPNPQLLDAFQHRAFPPQAQMPAPAFMPFGPGGPEYGHPHPHHHPMPQATGPTPFGGPPFM